MNLLEWLKALLGKKKEPELTPLAPIIKKTKIELKKRARKKKIKEADDTSAVTPPKETFTVQAKVVIAEEKKEPEVTEEKPKKEKKPRKPRKPKVEKPKEDASLLWANVNGTPEVLDAGAEWVSQDKPLEVPVPAVEANTEIVQATTEVVKKEKKRRKKKDG